VIGNALDAATFAAAIPPGATFVKREMAPSDWGSSRGAR